MEGGSWRCLGGSDRDHPKKNKCKKAKWLSEEALQIPEKRREAKGKRAKERYTQLNAEFQRIARWDKEGFLSDHWVGDDIQPSHPLSSPSLPALSFPVSGSFLMSQFFTSGGQSIRVSASASVLPMNIPDWFPLGLTGLISLQFDGFLRVFSSTTIQNHQFFSAQPSLWSNSHIHTWLLKNHSFD